MHSGCSRKAGKTSERIFSEYRKGRVRNTRGEGYCSWYVCMTGEPLGPAAAVGGRGVVLSVS